MLYGGMEAEYADLAGRQSLRWMYHELEYGGNYLGDAPDGGYRHLVDAMASGVDVRLGRPVSEIAVSPDGVRVVTADGTAEAGSHVVVTLPLGALKRGLPRLPLRCRPTGSRPSGGSGSAVSRRSHCGSPNPSGETPGSRTSWSSPVTRRSGWSG